MENLDKFTKFILLEEYYYDNLGGNLDILFQCVNELEIFIEYSRYYDIFKSGLDKFKYIDKINNDEEFMDFKKKDIKLIIYNNRDKVMTKGTQELEIVV